MFILYFIAIIPIIIYAYLYYKSKRVNTVEFIGCSITGLILAGIFHFCIHMYLISDVEVLSGQITSATYHPRWVEQYEVPIYRTETYTDNKGNIQVSQVFSHFETQYQTHDKYWDCGTSLKFKKRISEEFFCELTNNFNNISTVNPRKIGFVSGDRNIYVSTNTTNYIYPVTTLKNWKNRIKCSKTVFSYPSIPKDVKVFDYPIPKDWKESNRLINEDDISILEFDRLNTRLGPKKKVNVILINFGADSNPMMAQYQEAKYIGGKKNDIVICYGNKNEDNIPEWSYVFSWSETDLLKRNLETLLTSNKINNDILNIIEQEIEKHFEIKDWKKFDYITIYPPLKSIMLYIGIISFINIGLIAFILTNDFDKTDF